MAKKKTSSGTIVTRAQLENEYMVTGNHLGAKKNSAGIAGAAFHGMIPNMARWILVKARVFSIPPLRRMKSRALTRAG